MLSYFCITIKHKIISHSHVWSTTDYFTNHVNIPQGKRKSWNNQQYQNSNLMNIILGGRSHRAESATENPSSRKYSTRAHAPPKNGGWVSLSATHQTRRHTSLTYTHDTRPMEEGECTARYRHAIDMWMPCHRHMDATSASRGCHVIATWMPRQRGWPCGCHVSITWLPRVSHVIATWLSRQHIVDWSNYRVDPTEKQRGYSVLRGKGMSADLNHRTYFC